MLSNYYNDNEKVFIERVIDYKQGKPLYGPKEILHCFVREQIVIVKTINNLEVVSNASYASNDNIEVDDRINNKPVLSVMKPRGFTKGYFRGYV